MTDTADQIDLVNARQNDGVILRFVALCTKYGILLKRWISTNRKRLKPLLMTGALVLFCAGLLLSLRAYPGIFQQLRLAPLAVLLVLIMPIGLLINAVDYQLLARMSGIQKSLWQSLITIIYTRAANMLPIPGSMAVRMAILKSNGVALRKSGTLMFVFTAIWGGVGLCFSAIWLTVQDAFLIATIFASIGICILVGCFVAIRRLNHEASAFLFAAGLRLSLIVIEAFTFMIAFQAIGADVGYQQTAILVVASFIASIVPAGIGVRETLVAVLSPIAGIDPAIGFLAAATVRITGITFLAICSASVLGLSKLQFLELRR